MLKIKKLSFGYDEKKLFNDVSLQVSPGETLSILGPNGVGKTTLLKCIMGFIKPNSGDVFIDGRCSKSLTEKEFWRKVSYVPQGKQLNFPYSVLEMVLLGCASSVGFYGKPSSKDMTRAEEALDVVGVKHLANRSCGKISGGELQLVLIARAMIRDPQIMILDEPESNLDMKNQLMVLKVLESLKKEKGLTTILNTHYPNHSLKIAEKSLIMGYEGGHEVGLTDAIITQHNMRKYFNVESQFFDVGVSKRQWGKVFFADDIVAMRGVQ
jgi:iron complex transport system ATP-binding protein